MPYFNISSFLIQGASKNGRGSETSLKLQRLHFQGPCPSSNRIQMPGKPESSLPSSPVLSFTLSTVSQAAAYRLPAPPPRGPAPLHPQRPTDKTPPDKPELQPGSCQGPPSTCCTCSEVSNGNSCLPWDMSLVTSNLHNTESVTCPGTLLRNCQPRSRR